ncbi:hypothetical protein ACFX2F_037621 [Malus domestica]
MWWLWWMQVRRDKIEEATKKTTLKRQERSICLGRREKDRGGGYGGYKREGIGKTTEKRGLEREERENLFRQRRRELSSAVDSGRTPNHQPTVFAGSVVGIGWLSSIDLIEVIRKVNSSTFLGDCIFVEELSLIMDNGYFWINLGFKWME